ncbi:hypothetical protein MRB53_034644 [Persea americana]|uniref:Uncharacterized protein n=1 Tax=Persea americana TaxID=3435 RepID=A0ACC2K2V2_PERAE|nr:hypothetical protein MRB53_034644 [Persea americana]
MEVPPDPPESSPQSPCAALPPSSHVEDLSPTPPPPPPASIPFTTEFPPLSTQTGTLQVPLYPCSHQYNRPQDLNPLLSLIQNRAQLLYPQIVRTVRNICNYFRASISSFFFSSACTLEIFCCRALRVLVNLDVSKPGPNSISVELEGQDTAEVEILYENIPCSDCLSAGHLIAKCPFSTKPPLLKSPQTNQLLGPSPDENLDKEPPKSNHVSGGLENQSPHSFRGLSSCKGQSPSQPTSSS